jgi:hypothetical protein
MVRTSRGPLGRHTATEPPGCGSTRGPDGEVLDELMPWQTLL